MALTLEQLNARLTEAEDAYHALMLGNSARVVVDSNGERVEYTAANAVRLASYIESLKLRIKYYGTTRTSGPAGAFF